MEGIGKTVLVLLVLALASPPGAALAGGGAEPEQRARPEAARVDRPTATPAETEAALERARQAVPRREPEQPAAAPTVIIPRTTTPRPVIPVPAPPAEQPVAKDSSWRVQTAAGDCRPLTSLQRETGDIGTFGTPEEFARNLRQRGYQTFLLPLAENRIQVKVPDLDLAPLFVTAETCR